MLQNDGFAIVGILSGKIIQTDPTFEKAMHNSEILNRHNFENDHNERFEVYIVDKE